MNFTTKTEIYLKIVLTIHAIYNEFKHCYKSKRFSVCFGVDHHHHHHHQRNFTL